MSVTLSQTNIYISILFMILSFYMLVGFVKSRLLTYTQQICFLYVMYYVIRPQLTDNSFFKTNALIITIVIAVIFVLHDIFIISSDKAIKQNGLKLLLKCRDIRSSLETQGYHSFIKGDRFKVNPTHSIEKSLSSADYEYLCQSPTNEKIAIIIQECVFEPFELYSKLKEAIKSGTIDLVYVYFTEKYSNERINRINEHLIQPDGSLDNYLFYDAVNQELSPKLITQG